MKNISFLLLLVSSLFFAQNQRFTYEYSFKIDSLNRDRITKELMNLDVSKGGSNFYSKERFIYDSLMTDEFKKSDRIQSTNIDFRKIKNNAKVDFSVTKSYPSFETTLHTSISGDKFRIVSSEAPKWSISSDTDEIEGYKVQKATTIFLGRKWIAWFTSDIPIQDGPYRFSGLPGLILKLSDTKDDHIFTLIGSKNNVSVTNDKNYEKEIAISVEKFNLLWKEYLKDPAKKMRQMLSNSEGITVKITDSNGREISQAEIIRNREQRAKDNAKKNNNFLDLDLYQ